MNNRNDQYLVDFILCVLAGAGFSVNMFAGFEMNGPWQGNLLMTAGVVFAATAALFTFHISRFGVKGSAFVSAAALIGIGAALSSAGAFSGVGLIDESPGLFWIIVVSVPIIIFWMSRTRGGIIVFFLMGTLITTSFGFLEYPVSYQGYSLFVFSMMALFLYRVSFYHLPRSAGGGAVSWLYAIQPVAIALIAIVMAGGIFYGIVRPLAPQWDDAGLARKLMSMELLEDLGISSKKVVIGDNPEIPQDREKQYERRQNEIKGQSNDQNDQEKHGRLGISDNLRSVIAVSYEKHANRIWAAVLALILLASFAVTLKLLLRRKWYGNLLKKTDEEGAMELYLYFLKKLKKAGLQKPEGLTLLEYAFEEREMFGKFAVYDSSFLRLTQIYLKMLCGFQKISYNEYELFHDFYLEFHKNLRMEIGALHYYRMFFSL